MQPVCGVGFDLDHTLAIDNRLERVAFLRLLEIVLREGGRALGTLGDEIEAIDDVLRRQRAGDFSIDEAVRRFVAQRGVEPTQWHADTFRDTAVTMVDAFVVPLPGIERTLDALRERKIATAILSNGWNPLQQRKAERAGFRGPVLVSSEIGEQKPSPRAFKALEDALDCAPRDTLYVGDDPHSDVEGAHEAGMQTVWINWERQQYPPGLHPADHTIAQLDELLQVIPLPVRAR